MKLFILTILAVAQAGVIQENCDGVFIRNVYHERVVLKDGINSPYQLALDYDTKTLFFSLTVVLVDEIDTSQNAYIDLKTHDYGTISQVTGGFANAVDSKKHIVYFGGEDGLYTFNFDTKTAAHVAGNENIYQLFYKDRLYFTNYPYEIAYYYENEEIKKVEELKNTTAKLVAVDKNDNIYFSNDSGLSMYRRENGKIIYIGDYTVNAFTADKTGNVYFSTHTGVYSLNGEEVVKVFEIEGIFGLAIDEENNIILAEVDKISKLTPATKTCVNNQDITNNE